MIETPRVYLWVWITCMTGRNDAPARAAPPPNLHWMLLLYTDNTGYQTS